MYMYIHTKLWLWSANLPSNCLAGLTVLYVLKKSIYVSLEHENELQYHTHLS